MTPGRRRGSGRQTEGKARRNTNRRCEAPQAISHRQYNPERDRSNRPMPKITPFLWFDNQAEEAVNFYASIFPNSKIKVVTRYSDAGPGPKGSVMTVGFELD